MVEFFSVVGRYDKNHTFLFKWEDLYIYISLRIKPITIVVTLSFTPFQAIFRQLKFPLTFGCRHNLVQVLIERLLM